MYRLEFIESDQTFPEGLKTVILGQNTDFGYKEIRLLLYKHDEPILHISCFGNTDEYEFKKQALIWHDWIVVGFGHRVYLYHPQKHLSKVLDLGAYFCELYPSPHLLFAVSSQSIDALNPFAEMLWKAEGLGIDGIVIDKVEETILFGSGEFDPPGGWKAFKINAENGKTEWI